MVFIKWKILGEPIVTIFVLCPGKEERKWFLKTGVGKTSFHHISQPDSLIGLSLSSVGIGSSSIGTPGCSEPQSVQEHNGVSGPP